MLFLSVWCGIESDAAIALLLSLQSTNGVGGIVDGDENPLTTVLFKILLLLISLLRSDILNYSICLQFSETKSRMNRFSFYDRVLLWCSRSRKWWIDDVLLCCPACTLVRNKVRYKFSKMTGEIINQIAHRSVSSGCIDRWLPTIRYSLQTHTHANVHFPPQYWPWP